MTCLPKTILYCRTSAFKLLYAPGDGDELLEVQKIAESFERKTYAAATSQVHS